MNGHRVFVAVDANGELAGLRTLAPGMDPDQLVEDLWAELAKGPAYSATPSGVSSRPALQLIRGGLASGLLALAGQAAFLPPLAL